MIKVAALTSGRVVPSARFRVRQHIPSLRESGILVREFVPAIDKYASLPDWLGGKIRFNPVYPLWQGIKVSTRIPGIIGTYRSDVTWLERLLLPGFLTMEPLCRRPLVFDVDDAIWLSTPFGRQAVRHVARRADMILAGNGYIADWLSDCSRNIRVHATAVDTDSFRPFPKEDGFLRERFAIGWIGTSANLAFLEALEEALQRVLRALSDAVLLVVSDRPPAFRDLPGDKVRYIPWNEREEALWINQMDVGLMPLQDDEWARGKCSFKMLQYMACAKPVVVTPVGMNNEVLSLGAVGIPASDPGDWHEAISFLHRDRNRCRQYGAAGRKVVEDHFSHRIVARRLAEIFRTLG
jgi:glycosyltransferase involved in cell wall biosynthesis